MEIKKSPKADLQKNSSLYFVIGARIRLIFLMAGHRMENLQKNI